MKREATTSMPVMIETLERASVPLDAVAAIFDLAAALDPIRTPAHQQFVLQTMAGPRYLVAASELRRIFGRRRGRGPVPVGGVRPEDLK